MDEKLIIKKKSECEADYKTFSIRIRNDTVCALNHLSEETNRSRNELINLLLDFAIEHSEIM